MSSKDEVRSANNGIDNFTVGPSRLDLGTKQYTSHFALGTSPILAAFAKDTGPAAEAIKALLNNPSKEAAEALLADLPSLLTDDPALAAVIAEEMAKEFSVDGEGRAPSRPQPNKEEQPRGKSSPESTPGSFAPAGGGGTAHKGDEAKKEEPKGDEEALKARTPEQHAENGKTAITDILRNHQDVKGVMYRNSTGPIDFIWGYEGTAEKKFEDGRGISHINKKHNSTMYKLPGVIAHGAVYQHPDFSNRVGVIKGKMLVVLEKQGSSSYLLTGFKPDNPAEYLARFKSQEMYEGEL